MQKALAPMVEFLDRELALTEFKDRSNNGLQVQNGGTVSKICCGVDASLEFIEEAQRRGGDLLICHHGLSWGDSLAHITGLNYRRVGALLRGDMALYGCHLPLDAHPRLGNNAQICKALKLTALQPFGIYNGSPIGFTGSFSKPVPYETLTRRIARVMGRDVQSVDCGRKTIRSVAVVSGGAADEVVEAAEKGIDLYLTGEPSLSGAVTARDLGMNVVYAGHYATEVWGVRAVGECLRKRFKLPVEFIDLGIPF
jgi:dinuclear metal center YbgI/SA1388 family protein